MLATQVILCVTLIGNAVLFTAALKERPSLIRKVFALYVALIFGWTFIIFLNLFFSSPYIEEWVFATAAGMLTVQLWFVKLFPSEKTPSRLFKYWSLVLGCVFTLASFYPEHSSPRSSCIRKATQHSIAVLFRSRTRSSHSYMPALRQLFSFENIAKSRSRKSGGFFGN